MKAALLDELTLLPDPAPRFSLRLGWANDYDDLLRRKVTETDESTLLRETLKTGRCLLTGPGGGGKSFLLYRVMRTAYASGLIPILIDLRRWTSADYDRWKRWIRGDIAEGAWFLTERFSRPKVTVGQLDWLPPTSKKILLVDGLNELSVAVGQEILQALAEIVSDQIQTYVIVADRLVRRQLEGGRWRLASVLPFSDQQIRSYLGNSKLRGANLRPLDIPFFLDAALKSETGAGGRTGMCYEFLSKHADLDEEQIDRVSEFAFNAYFTNRARTFDIGAARKALTHELVQDLSNAVIISKLDDNTAYFTHHLVHDYLVARYVSKLNSEQWNRELLNAITFDRSSFDVAALILELLGSEEAATFLRHLYDWDLYAAGYALAEANREVGETTRDIEAVIFAMLAEKRFDIVAATRERANDALLIARTPNARPFQQAENLQGVFAAVKAVESKSKWFDEWRRLFTHQPASAITNDDLNQIRVGDSVKGWTVANVAKRLSLSAEQQGQLRVWATSDNVVVRWRIAHLLGSFPTQENFACLLTLFDSDPESDIRYGTIRSLAEMSARARDKQLRKAILDAIQDRAEKIVGEPRIELELSRALLVVPSSAPMDWRESIAGVARTLFTRSEAREKRQIWSAFVSRAEALYAGS